MAFGNIGPELIEMAMSRIGFAAGQLKNISPDTKRALVRFVMSAVSSGNADKFISERLAWLEERDAAPAPRPEPAVRATSRPVRTTVTAEVIDGDDDRQPRRRRL